MSATHRAFGRAAVNCRSTRSAGRTAVGSARVGAGRPGPSAAAQGAGEPSGAHDPFDGAPRDLDPFPVELTPDFPRAVHLVVVLPDSTDLDQELFVALCAGRRGPVLGGVIRGWGDL